jgi:5'-methylthioadenosine phosphorylase
MTLAVIGGSGFYALPGLRDARRVEVATPHGMASAPLMMGTLNGCAIVFLARHGERHQWPAHAINYRANVWALRAQGVTRIVAVATVGGIAAACAPGAIVVPDQIIDYTWGRAHTYFDGGREDAVKHIDFTQPYDATLRKALLRAARHAQVSVVDGATYAVTQGPRLETAAEISRLERDGASLVGMTGMPEAALARELGLRYATLAVVVNAAAGTGASERAIDLASAEAVAREAMTRVAAILYELAGETG